MFSEALKSVTLLIPKSKSVVPIGKFRLIVNQNMTCFRLWEDRDDQEDDIQNIY